LILDQVTANRELGQQQRFQSREQDLLQQVELALDHLQAEGKPITQRTVSCQVGISRATLRNYPQVTTRLAAAATDFYLARRRQLQDTLQGLSPTSPREAELVTAVQAAVEQLQAQNRVVTQKAVSQMVGLVLSTLRCYPRVKLLLELIAVETDLACQRQILSIPSKRQPSVQPNSDREAQLVAAVRAAMKLLKGQKTPITERRIAHIVGIGPSSLKRYAGIRDIFRRVAAERAQLKQLHRQQREQRLVVQIQEAVSHLETHDQPLTQANIIQLVGVSRSTLINFSQVRTLLNQIKAKRISTINFEAEQRDQALIEKTKQAAETLTRLGQRVTKHAIGQLVGLTPTGYKKYPQAHRFLDQVTRGE
jgi:transcriptional regulator with XRE-family HTH domain